MKMTTINEAARALEIPASQIRRGIAEGRYAYIPVGNRMLVDLDELTLIIRNEKAVIGVKAASELTGLSESTIRRGAQNGWLPCTRKGVHFEFIPGQLLEALQKMKTKK